MGMKVVYFYRIRQLINNLVNKLREKSKYNPNKMTMYLG